MENNLPLPHKNVEAVIIVENNLPLPHKNVEAVLYNGEG